MPEKEIMEDIIKKRQEIRKEAPQTRETRKFIKRKTMQPKHVQLQNLHYSTEKLKKDVILLIQKLDAFDRRLTEAEDHVVRWVEEEDEAEKKK